MFYYPVILDEESEIQTQDVVSEILLRKIFIDCTPYWVKMVSRNNYETINLTRKDSESIHIIRKEIKN